MLVFQKAPSEGAFLVRYSCTYDVSDHVFYHSFQIAILSFLDRYHQKKKKSLPSLYKSAAVHNAVSLRQGANTGAANTRTQL